MNLRRHLALAFAFVVSLTFFVIAAEAKKVDIIVSKAGQKMTVKVDGDTEYVWPVSTGAGKYETPSGDYKPFRMEAEHFSKEWDDAPMPNSIFFTGEGHAIHGSFHVKSLGRKASHGCVRLAPENAAILFALVSDAGMSNTHIVLKGGLFDFGFGTRSIDDVGNDIARTVGKAPSRGFFWSLTQPRKAKVAVKTVKKSDAKAKTAVAGKKVGGKPKKIVAVVEPKKLEVKAKKVADIDVKKPVAAKCLDKTSKKTCSSVPAPKAASNG
jgi:L,D-transpeptidase catalytic domain